MQARRFCPASFGSPGAQSLFVNLIPLPFANAPFGEIELQRDVAQLGVSSVFAFGRTSVNNAQVAEKLNGTMAAGC